MSIFQSEKPSVNPDGLAEKVRKAQKSERIKMAKGGVSRYYTNARVRGKIDKLLHERNALWSQFEHNLDSYKDLKKKKAQESENRRILKKMGAIGQQIKQADEKFFRQIDIDDNL